MMDATELGTAGRPLVERALAAPSSHNTQPWRVQCLAGAIEVSADPPQAVLCLGVPQRPPARSPRRPLAAVLDTAEGRYPGEDTREHAP